MPPIRVLLADDNITFRHGLRKLLESDARVEVVAEVGDGIAVVEQAKGRHPDVVLMDIRMPGQDGLAAAREIREHCPGVKVVVLTSYDSPVLRAQAREAGVSAYLLKAISGEKLLVGISEMFEENSLTFWWNAGKQRKRRLLPCYPNNSSAPSY